MQETLRHLDLAIEALRRSYPAHMMLRELEQCRSTLVKLDKDPRITPEMYAEWREQSPTSPCRKSSKEHATGLAGAGNNNLSTMTPEKRIYPMLLRTLAFGFALALASPADAANLPPAPTMPAFGSTASQLYHVCAEATHDSDLICQSFLAGIWEASRIISLGQHMSGDKQPSLCTPSASPIPVRELVAIYNRWVDSHPNNLEAAAGAAAMLAFGDAFPCPLPSASR